jgi:hypothetical protein
MMPEQAAKPKTPLTLEKPTKVDALVLKGQWVTDTSGKDLLLIDPTDQPYEIVYAD